MRYPEPYREDAVFCDRFDYEPPVTVEYTVYWSDGRHEYMDTFDNRLDAEDYADILASKGMEDIEIDEFEKGAY